MSKPNWKRRGLSRKTTPAELRQAERQVYIEKRIKGLPMELQEAIRRKPSLLSSL